MADFAVSRPPCWQSVRFRTDSFSCHQPPSDQEQVSEGEQREELGAVLGEPAIACLHVAKLPLEDAERMLDLGPDHRNDAIAPLVLRVKRPSLGRLAHDTPNLALLGERRLPHGADIALVGPDRGLVTMQQVIPDWLSWTFAVEVSRLWTMPL